ncbi:MAG TPA: glycosyl hydrolase family 18 protein, partial [Vicinamibacteria bacterium]
ASKLVLGVPFYGRAWVVQTAENEGLYKEGKRPAVRLETRYGALASGLVNKDGFVRRWDVAAQAPYLWNAKKRVFVSYDDPESMRLKARYVVLNGLAGVMFWEYASDPTGALLDVLHRELNRR